MPTSRRVILASAVAAAIALTASAATAQTTTPTTRAARPQRTEADARALAERHRADRAEHLRRTGQPAELVPSYMKVNILPVPDSLGVDPFYTKYVDAMGIPVLSSPKVPDDALLVARDIINTMLAARPDLRRSMVERKWRTGVIAEVEMTMDIPEYARLKRPGAPRDEPVNQQDRDYHANRSRGLGGNPTTGAEENLLGYPGTRYWGEHIFVHEFAHAIMTAVRNVDPAMHAEIRAAYDSAMAAGKYLHPDGRKHYATTNAGEYWAEGAQWWFFSNYGECFVGNVKVETPEEFKAYDPKLFELLGRVFTTHRIPMDVFHAKRIRAVTCPTREDVEQRSQGPRAAAQVVASFDGLGIGFEGPQGAGRSGNPSDNSLAVGPNHIVQTVNSRMAIFTKKGAAFDTTGKVLYGSVPTNNVFRGFTGTCEARNNGDAVVRYDQLADRWLIVMPIFSRAPYRADQPAAHTPADGAKLSVPGVSGQPGPAAQLYQPPPSPPPSPSDTARPPRAAPAAPAPGEPQGVYSMCYAISATADPLGAYYRYEFLRPLFPDYPRPAVWPDGYYVPTSTGDNRISPTVATQMHACVVDRASMLAGRPATEQCVIIENVNFLNTADLDGKALPPPGAPNIMMAAGGRQLDSLFADSVINVWQFRVDWKDPSKSKVSGPERIAVAPYHYLCNGQLSRCVPQPGTDRRLDSQGDKIMARLVYRRIGDRESIVATHSVNTSLGGGGVRWYEFRVGENRTVRLHQQGTFAPDSLFRWMASPAIDRLGNIGIGFSFGGLPHYVGQRFAGRLADDPPGQLTLRETILVEGAGSQTTTYRWQDYTQTAIDPSDDCTIWYVGDYFKENAPSYSTRIAALRLPGCSRP